MSINTSPLLLDLLPKLELVSKSVGIVSGTVTIITGIVKLVFLVKDRHSGELTGDSRQAQESIGKVLSALAVMVGIGAMVLYYMQFPYDSGKSVKTVHVLLFVSFGSILTGIITVIVGLILTLLMCAIYTCIAGGGFWSMVFDLSDSHSMLLGVVRLILFPSYVILSVSINYIVATRLFFQGFPFVSWLIGPFAPIVAVVLIAASLLGK